MTDTHTHLYFPDYEEGAEDLMKLCKDAGVVHLILPNVDEESLPQMKAFHAMFPNDTSMAIGLHPTEVKEDWERVVDSFEKELEEGDYIAVGEVGIDLYWDTSKTELQKKAFKRQLEIAEKHNLPVIIHSRNAFPEVLEIIEEVKPQVPLVFHSFTGDTDDVEKIRRVCDPFFGINGVSTYKNAGKLREALPVIGLDRILLETDSPYLSPVPHRGKPNNSSYIVHVCEKVAEVLGISPNEVEQITDRTAIEVFRLPSNN